MTAQQAAVCAEVVSGRRGKIPAPMIAWLRNPELARRGQKLGELLRFETTLEPHLCRARDPRLRPPLDLAPRVDGPQARWAEGRDSIRRSSLDIAARRTPKLERRAPTARSTTSRRRCSRPARVPRDLYARGIGQLRRAGDGRARGDPRLLLPRRPDPQRLRARTAGQHGSRAARSGAAQRRRRG